MTVLALLLFAAQTVPAVEPPPAREKWSILVPTETCTPQKNADGDDIVVCAPADPPDPIPYPDEAYGPRPSNPYLTGKGALEAANTPCAARLGGCTVGFGPPIVPIVKALAGVVGRTFAKKPDKTGRVAIPLDDPPPPPSEINP